MRARRLILAALVAAVLLPPIVSPDAPVRHHPLAPVRITALPVTPGWHGPVRLEAGWRLDSVSGRFGGYSGLMVRPGEAGGTASGLSALGDWGNMLHLRLVGGRPVEAATDTFMRGSSDAPKAYFDLEALATDPATGRFWVGVEGANAILRYRPDFQRDGGVRPAAMRDWPRNRGPEAMVRLADGRFLVAAEARRGFRSREHTALLFAGDPADPATPKPARLTLRTPGAGVPVDMATLADGRVLVLLRSVIWPWPPRFASALAVGDPAALRPGSAWPLRLLAPLGQGWPSENFEGLATEPRADGTTRIWIVSDDNQMARFQQTLLLRLRYDPRRDAGARTAAGLP